jgi:hypothetical protein
MIGRDLAFGGPVPESPAVGATAARVVCVRLPRTVGGGRQAAATSWWSCIKRRMAPLAWTCDT